MKLNKLFATLLILSIFSVVFAHPASDVKATFDLSKSALMVNYDHKVKDINDHYIKSVNIMLNDKEIITQKLSTQDSLNGGAVYYKVPSAKTGDKITIKTECSKGGKKSTLIILK